MTGPTADDAMGIAFRSATADDQTFVTEMQYDAFFVPEGAEPYPRSILDEPGIRPYHEGFGTRAGDVGRVAVEPESGRCLGAAWVRQHGAEQPGYGFVDAQTPELGIAVRDDARGAGVGAALLASLFEEAPRVGLSVDDRNPARRLYERFGFRTVRHPEEHSIVMVREGTSA